MHFFWKWTVLKHPAVAQLMHPLVFPEVEVETPCDGETAAVPAADAATEAATEGLTLAEGETVAARDAAGEGEAALEGLAMGEAETGLLELETWA